MVRLRPTWPVLSTRNCCCGMSISPPRIRFCGLNCQPECTFPTRSESPWPKLGEVACVAKPDTILTWYRKLVAQKFDGSKHRQYPGRPPVSLEVEALVVRMARENSGWGYDRIVGALANLGHQLSDQTVKNILRRHGIAPAPKRSQVTSWKDFLAAHMNVLAGRDFFTVEVLSWRGLVTYYVLFFLHLESRRVHIARITGHPDQEWMDQIGRGATQETWGPAAMCCTIATRSSVHRFGQRWQAAA
jgi:putative transposase